MVLHEGAKCAAKNTSATENDGSSRLSCHINVVVDCPAKTTADTLCNSLNDVLFTGGSVALEPTEEDRPEIGAKGTGVAFNQSAGDPE